jgi:hypothetical protein
MEILLIVAIVAVGAAGLYVAATFDRRAKKSTGPLIDDAAGDLSGKIEGTRAELGRLLDVLTEELRRDRQEIRLDDRKIQGRLDHADSRISNVADQLEAIRLLAEQIGERQDQLSADLRRLQAPHGGRAGEQTSGTVPADGDANMPVQLYLERLQFAIVRTPSHPHVRVQVERYITTLPTGQLGDLGDASAIINRADNDEDFRTRLAKAASDYCATQWGDPAFALVAGRWITQNTFPETAAAEACNWIANGLDAIVRKPLEDIGTEIRLPGPEAGAVAGIGSALVLQPVTEPLGQAAKFFEITGVVVGVATGFHPLALASAKLLARDEFHAALAQGIRDAAGRVFEGPGGPPDRRHLGEPRGPAVPAEPPGPAGPAEAPEPARRDQAPGISAAPARPSTSPAPRPYAVPSVPYVSPQPPAPAPEHPGQPPAPGMPGPV